MAPDERATSTGDGEDPRSSAVEEKGRGALWRCDWEFGAAAGRALTRQAGIAALVPGSLAGTGDPLAMEVVLLEAARRAPGGPPHAADSLPTSRARNARQPRGSGRGAAGVPASPPRAVASVWSMPSAPKRAAARATSSSDACR